MGRRWLVAAVLTGCYHPQPGLDQPCSATGECPPGQMCVADLCVLDGTQPTDAAHGDAPIDATAEVVIDAPIDAPAALIAWKSTSSTMVPAAMAANSITISRPNGCPGGHVLVAAIAMGNTGAAAAPDFTPPANWTLVHRVDHGNDTALVVYTHVTANNGEPMNYTWAISTTIEGVGWISCYSHVNTVTPVNVDTQVVLATAGPGYTAPSVTTTVPNTMLLTTVMAHTGSMAGSTWTTAAGNERIDLNNTTTRSGMGVDLLVTGTGPTATMVVTANEQQDYALIDVLALEP